MDKAFTLDLSSFSRELKLLIGIMGLDNNPEQLRETRYANIDWNLFLELARHHRVYPLVYANINKYGLNQIPEETIQALHRDYSKNTFKMLHFSGEMERICKLLHDNHIRSLMLKGPFLGKDLYGDISLRTSKDLDLLIPVEDIEAAERILTDSGFEVSEEFPRILNDWKWRFHHVSFFHPQTGFEIEVHWRLNPSIGYEPDFETLWNRRASSSLATNHPIYTLGHVDLYYYLAAHGARHAWFRLRWLSDMDRLIRKGIDWDHLHSLSKKYHSYPVLGQSFILASNLFHTPVDEKIQRLFIGKRPFQLAKDALRFMKDICSNPNVQTKHYPAYLFALKSGSEKLKFIMNGLRPKSTDAARFPLPKPLYFMYYILRPLLLMWRWMKRQAT